MPQNNRSVTDAYWKKRYKDAGVVPTGNGVRVTKPTSRVAVDNTWDARAKQSWLQNNYDPIATAIEKGNPNVVQSSVLDTARYGLQQGLLSQTQYDWVSKSIETMRKRMATTPVTSGGQSIPFGKWGLPDATKPGEFGPVQKPLMYSDLIQYNKDGSWGFTAPQSGAQVNQVTGVNKQRMDALMQNAQPINAGVETAANLGYGALGTAAALPLGLAYAAGYNGTNDPNSTWGRIESTAQGVLAGVPLAVSNAMSGVTANTSYLGGRMAGLSPEVANQRADTITQQSPWYQFSNEASAPGIENGDFQLGTTIGKELTTAVPAMYASLGLLNASASLGGRLLAPFGTQASSVGRMAGLGTAVVAPPLMTGFRDQLTGGKSGIREDIIAGIETLSDPIRSPQQRGMSENERIAQQEFDPEGKVAGAFQQAGVLAMASGGASQMWRDVVSNAKKGMWEFRGALKETNNPFKASGAGIGALVENEIGRAAMTDLGFATTQPLGDIGRKIYAQMRYDKSKPYEEPTWGDIFKSFALGLVASRPGQKAQWIFRGNPLSSLDPKTMAMAHAVDIVNQGTPEVSALREHIRSMRPDGLEPNETDIRRVASAMAADNNANIAQTRRAGTLPEGTRVFRTNAEYVADYLKNPELYPEEVRTKYDAMFDNVRSESDEVNIDDENVLNKIPVSPEYDTDLALRKRRIANLTDRLIPHYTEMLKQTTESGTDKPLPPSRYYGIDLGDGNMIVYNSNFDSAIMMPLKESPDIVMLKEQRISDTNHTYDHEERLQAYDAFEELMRLHGDPVQISLRRVVPIGFSADGLVVRAADGEMTISQQELQQNIDQAKAVNDEHRVDKLQNIYDLMSTVLKDKTLHSVNDYAPGVDTRYEDPIGPESDLTGNKIASGKEYDFYHTDHGVYLALDKTNKPIKGEMSNDHQLNMTTGRMRIPMGHGDNFYYYDVYFNPDQLAAIEDDGATAPSAIMRSALDVESSAPSKYMPGDILNLPNADGSTSRYVVMRAYGDGVIALPVDNLNGIPALVYDNPAIKVESLDRDYLRDDMDSRTHFVGEDASAIRPSDDPISNITKYALWMAGRDSVSAHELTIYSDIVSATMEELPDLITQTIHTNIAQPGVERNVIASIREWMLKNPDHAIAFEQVMSSVINGEMNKSATDRSIEVLSKYLAILEDADLNDLLDQINNRYESDETVSSETYYSSSPRRLRPAQGELSVMMLAVDSITRYLRKQGSLSDEQARNFLRSFLSKHSIFQDRIEDAVTKTLQIAKLKSSLSPHAAGIIFSTGKLWMLKKISALPHDIQQLVTLLPYDTEMSADYKDSFGNWDKTEAGYDAAVTRAKELYSQALNQGGTALEVLKNKMDSAGLLYFYKIAEAGPDIARPVSADITSPRATEVMRANLQKSRDAMRELITKAATEKVAILSGQLARNQANPDAAVPVNLGELTTAVKTAAPEGIIHTDIIGDVDALSAMVADPTFLDKTVTMVNKLIDDVENASAVTGIEIMEQDGIAVNSDALRTAQAAKEAEAHLTAAVSVYNQLPEAGKTTLFGIASPIMWLVDVIRAVDRSGSLASKEALVFGIYNAVGGSGRNTVGISLSSLFINQDKAALFERHASDAASKRSLSEESGESGATRRKTSINEAMNQLRQLANEIAGQDDRSILESARPWYETLNLTDLHTFTNLASKEIIRSLISNATRIGLDDATGVLAAINGYSTSYGEMSRRYNNFVGSEQERATLLQMIDSVTTSGMKYLGVRFDPTRRLLITDVVNRMTSVMENSGLNAQQKAEAIVQIARETSSDLADFVLGDQSLTANPAAAYTPANEVASTELVRQLSDGVDLVRSGTATKDTSQLLLAGNRAGLEKIILTTLLDAISRHESNNESIEKSVMSAVIGPENANRYFARQQKTRFVLDNILTNKNPILTAAVIPGSGEKFTLAGGDNHPIVEGQAVLNAFVEKMSALLKPSEKSKFNDVMAEYIAKKRQESGSQDFTFHVADLMTIAEGFDTTRNNMFKPTLDGGSLTFGIVNKDAHSTAYKIKSILASIAGIESKATVSNRLITVDSQFEGSAVSIVEHIEGADIFTVLPEEVVTANDAAKLQGLYRIMSQNDSYTPQQRTQFKQLSRQYGFMSKSSTDSPVSAANKYSQARSVAANLSKVYDTYAARQATNLISTDINLNVNLREYQALASLLHLDNDTYQKVLAASRLSDLLGSKTDILSADKQKQLIALRAAQLKQDFYNQHHKLFFAHEAMLTDIGYTAVQDKYSDVEAFIRRTEIEDGRRQKSIGSILYMAGSNNFGKSALALSHEVSHHLFYSLPDKAQINWISAVSLPFLRESKDRLTLPEMQLFHDYLNAQKDASNAAQYKRPSIEQFAAGKNYTREQIRNANIIFAETAATSMVNFILHSGVVHDPSKPTMPVAEDLTATLLNLQSVLAPIAKTLASEYGPYTNIDGKPTNVFYYRPTDVVYQTTSSSGVNRRFTPLKHGSFVSFINDVGKKYSQAVKTYDLHDFLVEHSNSLNSVNHIKSLLSSFILDSSVREQLATSLKQLNDKGYKYGVDYRINISGDGGFVKQPEGQSTEQGYSVTGKVSGVLRESVTSQQTGTQLRIRNKNWIVETKNPTDKHQWYGLNIYETMTTGMARIFQRGTKGDYGYVVESTGQIRINSLHAGRENNIDLGDNALTLKDVKLNYMVGHDYIESPDHNFHVVGTTDATSPAFASLIYDMMARIDRNIIDIAGQRTYEYELRINRALSEGMATGNYDKWNEVVSVPLAMSLNKDIKNIIANTPREELVAVQQTGTHPWLRNQAHSRSLYRWARGIADESVRNEVLSLIDVVTQNHAQKVGMSNVDTSITNLTDRLLQLFKEPKNWYSFLPYVASDLAGNSQHMNIVATAAAEQLFESAEDVYNFLQVTLPEARRKMLEDKDATGLRDYLSAPETALAVIGDETPSKTRSFNVKIDNATVDTMTLFDQLFGINVDDQAFVANQTEFFTQWTNLAISKWMKEQAFIFEGNVTAIEPRLKQLHQLLTETPPTNKEELAAIMSKVGLAGDYIIGGKKVDLSSLFSYYATNIPTPEQFASTIDIQGKSGNLQLLFNPESALKVVPHAVLDHIFTKVFTNDAQRINFLQALSDRVPDNGTADDILRARNMFNVVEHIVLTDAKIRNASLRNWKSYSVVTTEPDTNSVIIKSPDRDIAADTKTASESGAMYRVNLETGEVNLVSKTKRYDPRSGKYVEDYVNVKNVDDFIRYNYTKSPNGNPKKDPMRFDAENNATRYTAEQIFGDTNPNRFLASLFEDGDIVVVDAMSNDLPLYFLLPQTLKTIADSGSHVNATFENDGASLSAHSNDGMHLVKAEWNKKDKTWVFRQASNNWQNSANYRSQMPMELLQMVMRPFEKSSGLTLSSEKLAELTQHKMLHEEYHIAKMLLARDRASASPKHLDISKVGQKLLFPTTGNMQDASTGTWFSSSPKFMEGNADNIPLQREQSAVILDTDNDPYLDTSREALDEYTSMTKKAYDTTPEDMTFYRDENTRGGIIKSGTDKNPVLQVSTDIWDTSVGQFLTDTPYDTTVEDRSAITLSGDELETVFSASPKLRDAAYNANKYVFAPFRALSTFATLALDVSSLAIQLGTQIRNPLRLMKAILCTIPEAVAFGTNDIGFMFGNLIHAKRVANRMAGRGNWATQSLDLGPRYYNFIMNSIVDRWNKTHKWSTPITMSDLITKYYMQGAYSDWYRQHEKNALKDPSKYKDIIDTPWTSDRENSFANELPTALFPAARRWDMSRQLLIDLCMIQNALAAVEAGRKLKVGANGKSIEEWEINRNIRARLSDFAKEFGVSSHADSKTQAPLWKILAKIVQYPQTAPGYNRSFAQYWGFTPFLGIKRSINDVARVATANGPKWLRGDIYNIESDEVYNKYQTNWSKDLKARDKLTTIAAWSGLMILNSVLNWNEHQKENPGEEFDVTEWWNVTSKRFGYNRLNDNWVFQIPVLGRMSQYIKPLTALADKSNYGPKEKIQALRETMVNTYMKNKINNAGQYVISSVLGKTYDGRPAYERNQGLRLAVANDVRAPMYFHPAGYLMPNQSNLTMDTLTFAHTNQYYDDLLKLAVFSQMNKKQLTLDELNRVASMPNRIAISKKAANELFIKGMIGRLAGLNLMYEPKEYQLVNKEPVSLDSDVTLGRFAYMVRDWYKYPNLFQTFRQNPSDVFFGYPIDNIGGQALGLPASESTSRAVRNPNMRLPVSNVNRALIDKARSEQ